MSSKQYPHKGRVGLVASVALSAVALLALCVLLSDAAPTPAADAGLWITAASPTGGAGAPFDAVEIVFSESVMTGTFTLDDVTVGGPGGPITPAGLTQLAADRYLLDLAGQTGLNTYSLSVGTDVLDLDGGALDQDHDGVPGEFEDRYVAALFGAGAVITGTQTTYEGQHLVIHGDDSTIDGSHAFGSLALLGGAALAHSTTTADTEYRLELVLTDTLHIDAASRIDVSGLGYRPGRTLGNTTIGAAVEYAGGSYGGYGAVVGSGATNAAYGDYRDPDELGSGGAVSLGSTSAGGGLVRITAGDAVVEGQILANAGLLTAWGRTGSGGGVLLRVGALSGNGFIAADGGECPTSAFANSQGGGGGRVAVYYDALAGFDLTHVTAWGGRGDATDAVGGAGSVYLKRNGGEGRLVIRNRGVSADATTPLGVAADSVFVVDHLIISGTNAVVVPEHDLLIRAENVTVQYSATLSHKPATADDEYALRLAVTDTLHVAATGRIDVTAKGYLPGRTLGNTPTGASYSLAGGSYGGYGAVGSSSGTNAVYGDYRNPDELGSGSGSEAWYSASTGGGLVRITAGTAAVDGEIVADGSAGPAERGMRGSGGGVLLDVGTLSGAGSISAHGGDILTNYGWGGGGGRVAVYYDTLAGFDLSRVTARGGHDNGTVEPAAAGTVYLKQNGGEGRLVIQNQGPATTVYTPLGLPADTTFLVDHLVVSGANSIAAPEHNLPVEAQNVTVELGGTLTHRPATADDAFSLRMTISDTLHVAATGRIDVTAKGYLPGRTLGNTPTGAAYSNAGGSYGGYGPVVGSSAGTNAVYGDYRNPDELGSGSGSEAWYSGSAGGGLVRIAAGAAVLDGEIIADGSAGPAERGMRGSGGGVLLDVGQLSGAGSVSANGGDLLASYGWGGGGGRVAVYYDALAGFDLSRVTARGGHDTGTVEPAAAGTVYLKQNGGEGRLVIENQGPATTVYTPLGLPADTTFLVDHLVVSGANSIAAPEHNLPVEAQNVTVELSGTLTHRPASVSEEFSLRMTISDTLTVAATGRIDVSGKGYAVGRTLGNTRIGAAVSLAGGSHGGRGATGSSAQTNLTYGDPRNPNDLGSGSGSEAWYSASTGGGLVRIIARTAVVDGQILADGSDGAAERGMRGSGGGVLINTGTLSGAGFISAGGGDLLSSYGWGGGGGRVAVYTWDALALPAGNITANGGLGSSGNGEAGSVYLGDEPLLLWTDPPAPLFHGTEWVGWIPFGLDPDLHTVDLQVCGGGVCTPLGLDLPGWGGAAWDTASDGRRPVPTAGDL